MAPTVPGSNRVAKTWLTPGHRNRAACDPRANDFTSVPTCSCSGWYPDREEAPDRACGRCDKPRRENNTGQCHTRLLGTRHTDNHRYTPVHRSLQILIQTWHPHFQHAAEPCDTSGKSMALELPPYPVHDAKLSSTRVKVLGKASKQQTRFTIFPVSTLGWVLGVRRTFSLLNQFSTLRLQDEEKGKAEREREGESEGGRERGRGQSLKQEREREGERQSETDSDGRKPILLEAYAICQHDPRPASEIQANSSNL